MRSKVNGPEAEAAELHLGARALPLNGRASFRCPMLAEPAGQLEFVWYLNNSLNARRPLWRSTATAEGGAENQAELGDEFDSMRAGAGAQKAARRSRDRVAVSQFQFSVASQADYGRLYCLARNAIGEQKRACVYTIEPPESRGAGSEAADFDAGKWAASLGARALTLTPAGPAFGQVAFSGQPTIRWAKACCQQTSD